MVTDAGHDATENLLLFGQTPGTDFVVKRNLRRQDPTEWLQQAQLQTGHQDYEHLDCGARCWYGERREQVSYEDQNIELQVVWRATKRFARPDGQYLVEPEITIDAYWTSLDWTPKQVQAFYQQRGTSEQFYSEFKGDLDLERLPSGKLAANQSRFLGRPGDDCLQHSSPAGSANARHR